jgi:hypothetical protein
MFLISLEKKIITCFTGIKLYDSKRSVINSLKYEFELHVQMGSCQVIETTQAT